MDTQLFCTPQSSLFCSVNVYCSVALFCEQKKNFPFLRFKLNLHKRLLIMSSQRKNFTQSWAGISAFPGFHVNVFVCAKCVRMKSRAQNIPMVSNTHTTQSAPLFTTPSNILTPHLLIQSPVAQACDRGVCLHYLCPGCRRVLRSLFPRQTKGQRARTFHTLGACVRYSLSISGLAQCCAMSFRR